MVLDQNAYEALQRAQDGAMQHHRGLAGIVVGDVLRVQPAGQLKVDLQGAALPHAIEAVFQRELDLGSVERPLPRLQLVLHSLDVQSLRQGSLGAVPRLVRADALIRARR